ncbi:thioesterase family protein [Spirillospora sp. NPDC029432]|uniref:thioesterase family protein n=1 Tax=Spirillospora sp. NPDC029432 TaxID=3154599 RepID=UPI003451DF1F
MTDAAPAADAFYEPLGGGRFASTPATAGPWSPGLQHGGPVSALIGRALERHDPVPGTRIARVTVEILRPVPVAPLEAAVRTVRPGRRVSLLEGELSHEGRPVVRATAWRIAAAPAGVERSDHTPAAPPLPAAASALDGWESAHLDGYLSAMEWRLSEGRFGKPGPGGTWARSRVPLVAGEEDTPLVRTLTLADSMSGIGSQLDLAKWLIINTDMTVALHRDPVGEWLFMRASVNVDPNGSALAQATLADTAGAVGRGLQTMLVDDLPAG